MRERDFFEKKSLSRALSSKNFIIILNINGQSIRFLRKAYSKEKGKQKEQNLFQQENCHIHRTIYTYHQGGFYL